MRRVRKVKCFRSRRCIGASPVCRCAAGTQASYAPQASGIGKPLFYGPAGRFEHRQQPPKRRVGAPPEPKGPPARSRHPRPTRATVAPFCGAQTTPFRRHSAAGPCRVRGNSPGAQAGIGSPLQLFFKRAHDRLGTDPQYPSRVAYPTPIQRHLRHPVPHTCCRHLMTILQLERAPTARTAVALGAIRGFAGAIDRVCLLAARTENG